MVVLGCVGANPVPAPAFVYTAVLADQEAVADVVPTALVHVQVLIRADDGGTALRRAAVVGDAAVVHQQEGAQWVALVDSSRRPSTPLVTRHNFAQP